MAKAKKSSDKAEVSSLIAYIKERADFILGFIKSKVDEIKRMIMKRIIVFCLFWFGVLFILFGIAMKLVELFPRLQVSGGYLLVGGFLLVVALIYYAGSKR